LPSAVLDAHYAEHPGARPSLEEIVLAAAQLDANPLADRPDLLTRAAAEIGTVKDDPTPDDVLLYAEAVAARNLRRAGSVRLVVPHAVLTSDPNDVQRIADHLTARPHIVVVYSP
jgi:hypothetical protein